MNVSVFPSLLFLVWDGRREDDVQAAPAGFTALARPDKPTRGATDPMGRPRGSSTSASSRAKAPHNMYALAGAEDEEEEEDDDDDDEEEEPRFVHCFGDCPSTTTSKRWKTSGLACCGDARLFNASYCHERSTADLICDLELVDSDTTTAQKKLFTRLTRAGIYETATDQKVNDANKNGSTVELLARNREAGKVSCKWDAKPVAGAQRDGGGAAPSGGAS